MNSKERLDAFVQGKTTDRRPNLTIVGSFVTQYNDIDIETYCKDYKKMLEASILCTRDVGIDYVQIASDLLREAEGFGSTVEYYPDRLPTLKKPAVDSIEEAAELKPIKTKDIPRMYDLVLATKEAIEQVDDVYPFTLIVGPVTIAGNTRGVSPFMKDVVRKPDQSKKFLEVITETIIDFIDELAAVGAKYIYLADPIASLISPKAYADMAIECHEKIYGHMNSLGITGRLHMCGNTEHLLPLTATTGVKIIDIDTQVNYKKALELVDGKVILNGNINPVDDVFSSTAEHTYNAIINLSKEIQDDNNLLMPGCELPTKTPKENVRAITRALKAIDS